jgi:cysteine protease ATG4
VSLGLSIVERVRKMPLSGLDHSMLLGFLCKDGEDREDFRRIVEVSLRLYFFFFFLLFGGGFNLEGVDVFALQLGRNHKPIFTIQDEPLMCPSDTDEFMGVKSISEPDDMDMDDNDNDKEKGQR